MPKRLRHRNVELPPHTATYQYVKLVGWSIPKWQDNARVRTWRATVCYLDIHEGGHPYDLPYTVAGLAFCAPGDNFSRAIGRAIAQGRAQQALADLLCKQAGSPHVHLRSPALTHALERAHWPQGNAVICSPYGFRLPKPEPVPLHPLYGEALLTGEVGRVENVHFVSIYDERTKPSQ